METERQDISRLDKFLGWSRYWVLFVAGFLAVMETSQVIVGSVLAWSRGFVHPITLTRLLVQGLFFIFLYAFGSARVDDWFGTLCIGVAMYFTGDWIFELDRPSSFTLATTYWGAVIVVGIIGLASVFLRVLILLPRWLYTLYDARGDWKRRLKVELQRQQYAGLVLLALVGVTGVTHAVISSPFYGHPITVQPQDYPIEFRFWAAYDPAWYLNHPNGTQILEQFDRHSVVIQCAWIPLRDASGNLESLASTVYQPDIDRVVSNLTWFATHYPKIRFQYYAAGVGYNSCGNYEGSIYTPILVRRFVDVCRNYSLPNVVGIYTDWEGPSRGAPRASNETRNGWHQALWADAFAYVRTYFPDWTMSCCYPEGVAYDGVDDDMDLQLYRWYNIFVPRWDDYGPMIYRSCDSEPGSYDVWDDKGSWYVYGQARALVEGALNGDAASGMLWLGCTGCGPYENKTTVMEHGKPLKFGAGKGFDAFARDILVLKHFGFRSVSIFHGIETFDDKPYQTGFFHQYGFADALDRLAAIVNGPNSTDEFTIWSNGLWTPVYDITLDFQLKFDRPAFLLVGLGAAGTGFLFMRVLGRKKQQEHSKRMASESETKKT